VRVALVYRSFHLGGSLPMFQVELARYLVRRDHDVHVYSIADATDRSVAPGCMFHDVPVRSADSGARASGREQWSFARNARTMLARERYDAVQARTPSTWEADLLTVSGVMRGEAELAGLSRSRYLASTARHPGSSVRLLVERRAIRNPRVQRFNVDAPAVAEHLTRIYGVDPDRITVTTPSVDPDVFRPAEDKRAARAVVGLPADDRFLVLFCGHDFQRKGLDRAIDALAAMRQEGELVVVGESPEAERFRRLAGERGVGERVHFVGGRSDTERFFCAADAFLLPTRVDVWGVTVLEAMASEVPPIVSDAAGAASVVEHGRTGFVLPEPASTEGLRTALDELAASVELRAEMGTAARDVARRHTWDDFGRIVENELTEIASRPRRVA
jgi:glycosyltransferase involved in cell wall biosynthesis